MIVRCSSACTGIATAISSPRCRSRAGWHYLDADAHARRKDAVADTGSISKCARAVGYVRTRDEMLVFSILANVSSPRYGELDRDWGLGRSPISTTLILPGADKRGSHRSAHGNGLTPISRDADLAPISRARIFSISRFGISHDLTGRGSLSISRDTVRFRGAGSRLQASCDQGTRCAGADCGYTWWLRRPA